MIHSLIFALGLQVIFSDNPLMSCGNARFSACYIDPLKRIVLIMDGKGDINESMYHETFHNPYFQDDKEIREMIAKYPAPRYYPSEVYDTADKQLGEKIADFGAMYLKYPDFPDKFPEVKELFDRKVKSIIK